MQEKSYGQDIFSKKLLDQLICSLNMSLTVKKLNDIMEVITLLESNLPFMKCGITNHGAMKLRNQKLLFKQL